MHTGILGLQYIGHGGDWGLLDLIHLPVTYLSHRGCLCYTFLLHDDFGFRNYYPIPYKIYYNCPVKEDTIMTTHPTSQSQNASIRIEIQAGQELVPIITGHSPLDL